ncbi:MAG: aminopeptidase P family protein [Saprospiraceae bacterium]
MIFKPQQSEFYSLQRKALTRELIPNSIVILHSNDKMPLSSDQYFPFRQNKDLLKLCGIYQEDTAIVLFPDHPAPEKRELLFIRRNDDHIKTWEGEGLDKSGAIEISGIEQVYWYDQFESIVYPLITKADHIYLNSNEKGSLPQEVQGRNERLGKNIQGVFPFHKYHRLQPIIRSLNLIKSIEEIEAIRQAIKLTGDTWNKINSIVFPGMYEFEIAAAITYEFEKNGAIHAFEPIVASGLSSCILHYKTNSAKCKSEDILLIDFGAELNGYAADMTRCMAVDGTMNSRQFKVYDTVLNLFIIARGLMKPGITLDEINGRMGPEVTQSLLELEVITIEESKDKNFYKKYLPHGISHFLGMDVHDYGDRYTPLAPGMIITCEPGIYIKEERIGIRLENDILITDIGNDDLMKEFEL